MQNPGGCLNRDVLYPNMSYSVTKGKNISLFFFDFDGVNIVLNLLHWVSTAEFLSLSNDIVSSGGRCVFLPLALSSPRAHGSEIERQDFSTAHSHRVLKAMQGSARLLGCKDQCQAVQNFTLHCSCMPGLSTERDHSTVALLLNSSLLNISGKVLTQHGNTDSSKISSCLVKQVQWAPENLVLCCTILSTMKAFQT